MIPVTTNYSIQGMSTINFSNIIANTSQTHAALPISALGNILQLHCNPSLTLQVNGASSTIPISTKESATQEQPNAQINTFRNIFSQSYQNSQSDQSSSSSTKGFNQLIQDLISTYQTQQETLSQINIKYNFLLNAMERLLFDVQNNVEYSLLALGISQTINKVKLNQLNHLNCTSLISNGVIPMINQSQIFSSHSTNVVPETAPISSVIDLTNQRNKIDSCGNISNENKPDFTKFDSSDSTSIGFKNQKLTSLDKLDKLIDETVKKSTGRLGMPEEHSSCAKAQSNGESNQSSLNTINVSMGNAIQQIIRQFYQNNASLASTETTGFNGVSVSESSFPNLQMGQTKSLSDNNKPSSCNFNPNPNDILTTTQIPINNLSTFNNHSFILCNNINNNSVYNSSCRDGSSLPASSKNAAACSSTELNYDSKKNIAISNADEIDSSETHDEDDNGTAELDPTEVATRIRDILSLHSIGQRLFAKHVLNLSQGTVSELLSKPKPWSKLSEKGRDSYRKMNQWAQDNARVQELKSIAPRKGFSGHYAGMSPATPIKEDQETQEKIKRILNDAKMAMASTGNPNNHNGVTNTFSDDLYDFNKKESNNGPKSNQFSNSLSCSVSSSNNKTNILEFDMGQLQKKIASLQTNHITPEGVPTTQSSSITQQSPLIVMNLSNLVSCASSLVLPPVQTQNSSMIPILNTKIISQKSANSNNNNNSETNNNYQFSPSNETVFPKCEYKSVKRNDKDNENEYNEYNQECNQSSELLTNSDHGDGLATSSNSSKSSEQENIENIFKMIISSFKATENNLQDEEINTVELVNIIKDHLTKNSISQRTFGYQLGLSQGSVSDILSRPKSWSMLTNKGREPYLRMLKYLLKPNTFKLAEFSAVKIDIQDSTPPNSSCSPISIDAVREENSHILSTSAVENNIREYYNASHSCSTEDHESDNLDDEGNLNPTFCEAPISDLSQIDDEKVNFDDSREKILSLAKRITNLDTVATSTSVREILSSNNLGQRLFGERILSLSQGSVSELLSKPKHWNQLSLKGREPYIRMYLWLKHPQKIELLNINSKCKTGITFVDKQLYRKNELESHEPPATNYDMISLDRTIIKKSRMIFSDLQRTELQSIFDICPYPKTDQLEELSKKYDVPFKTISNWFHNRRMRTKSTTTVNELKNYFQSHISSCDSLPTIERKHESGNADFELDSERSNSLYQDEVFPVERYSLDESDSENSLAAPYLHPEFQVHTPTDNYLIDKGDSEDFEASSISLNHVIPTIGGSNKRKRANPIKLEMVLNKTSPKGNEDAFEKIETESNSEESKENLNEPSCKLLKLEKL